MKSSIFVDRPGGCIYLPSFASIFLLSEVTGATILFETFVCASCRVTVESRKGKSFCSNIHKVLKYCRNLTPTKRALMGEVILMTILATNASSERVFSTLRYIKNYLRTTMFQERLNNLIVTYKDRLDLLDLTSIAQDFVVWFF